MAAASRSTYQALDLQARYGYGLYDCLIVSGALQHGCKRLLTGDPRSGQSIEYLRIENPFALA